MKAVLSVMMGMALAGSVLAQDTGQCPANPVVYPPFTYAWSSAVEGLFKVDDEETGLSGVLRSDDGKLILPMVYQDIEVCADRMIAEEEQSGLYGLFDLEGRELLPPTYPILQCPVQGMAIFTDEQGLQGVVNAEGKVVVAPQYTEIQVFQGGMAAVDKDGRFGLINTQGEEVVAPQYVYAEALDNGLALVQREDLQSALLNDKGELVFPFTLAAWVVAGGEDWVTVSQDDTQTMKNIQGETLFTFNGAIDGYFPEVGLFSLWDGGKNGFIDETGKEVVPPRYEESNGFSEGLAAVRAGDKWGYVNAQGEVVIAPQFTGNLEEGGRIGNFYQGSALVFADGKGFLIDKAGKKISRDYAQVEETVDHQLYFTTDEGKGVLARDGRELLPAGYDEVVSFAAPDRRFLVKSKDGIWQLRDEAGCVYATQGSK